MYLLIIIVIIKLWQKKYRLLHMFAYTCKMWYLILCLQFIVSISKLIRNVRKIKRIN